MGETDVSGMVRERMMKAGLSKREVEVLRLYMEGKNSAVIAAELGMSPKTANVHLQNLRCKMRASGLGIGRRIVLTADERKGGADHG